jgi:hypothetical protein
VGNPVSDDSPEVRDTRALAGFRAFAAAFTQAVERHDTQALIDMTYFEDRHCNSTPPAETPRPDRCISIGPIPDGPSISVGLWNSEGDYMTPAGYAEVVHEYLDEATAPFAYVYAMGHQKRGRGELASGVDLVVAKVSNRYMTETPGAELALALVFRADVIGGEWRIVDAARGSTTLVPDFFDWFSLWENSFAAP